MEQEEPEREAAAPQVRRQADSGAVTLLVADQSEAAIPLRTPVLISILCLAGCGSIGAGALNRDHLNYAKALADAQKRETLFNIVRLRYGDVPVFLSTNQIIAGYNLQGELQVGNALSPNASTNSFFTSLGSVQYSDHPTFTFTPITGEGFAEAYIRPLSPVQLLPLAQGGLPIDTVFRLGVQSIGDLRNSAPLNGPAGVGSPDFFRLIADLRQLQVAGALGLRLQKDKNDIHIFAFISEPRDPAIRAVAAEVRKLLGWNAAEREAEIVYGDGYPGHGRIAILTRSILAMLEQVGSQIQVPEQDVVAGRTVESLPATLTEMQPVVAIHSGPAEPSASAVALNYRGAWFWVDDADFKSKVGLTILELVKSIAESSHSQQAPVITIPVG